MQWIGWGRAERRRHGVPRPHQTARFAPFAAAHWGPLTMRRLLHLLPAFLMIRMLMF